MSQSPTKELDHQGSFHSPEAAVQNYPGGAMSERPLGSERCHTTLIHTHKWVARNCFPTPVKLVPRCPPQLKLIGKPGASWALLAEQGVATAEVWSLPLFFPKFHTSTSDWPTKLVHLELSWKRSGRCGFSSPSSAGQVATPGGR